MSWTPIQLSLALLISVQVATFATILGIRYRRRQRRKANKFILGFLNQFTLSPEMENSANTLDDESARKEIVNWFRKTWYGRWFSSTCVRAGNWSEKDFSKWVGRKFEWSIAGLIVSILGVQLFSTPEWLLFTLPIVGFLVPDYLLYGKGKARSEQIARALPETIDLLNMTVGAGLGFQAGLDRISRAEGNPLGEEFRRVLAEIRLGDSRSHAFSSMANRINRPEIWNFTNAILQVEKLGIPITSALRDQAKSIRAERRERARETAQKLPVKILAPIMLLLLPSVLIIVLGPAIFSILGSFI